MGSGIAPCLVVLNQEGKSALVIMIVLVLEFCPFEEKKGGCMAKEA